MIMIWMFPKSTEFLIVTIGLGPNIAFVVNIVVAIALTLVSASVLYVTVERPCMRFRKHPIMSWIDGTSDSTDSPKGNRVSTLGAIDAEIASS